MKPFAIADLMSISSDTAPLNNLNGGKELKVAFNKSKVAEGRMVMPKTITSTKLAILPFLSTHKESNLLYIQKTKSCQIPK